MEARLREGESREIRRRGGGWSGKAGKTTKLCCCWRCCRWCFRWRMAVAVGSWPNEELVTKSLGRLLCGLLGSAVTSWRWKLGGGNRTMFWTIVCGLNGISTEGFCPTRPLPICECLLLWFWRILWAATEMRFNQWPTLRRKCAVIYWPHI